MKHEEFSEPSVEQMEADLRVKWPNVWVFDYKAQIMTVWKGENNLPAFEAYLGSGIGREAAIRDAWERHCKPQDVPTNKNEWSDEHWNLLKRAQEGMSYAYADGARYENYERQLVLLQSKLEAASSTPSSPAVSGTPDDVAKEQARWQDAIYQLLVRICGDSIDGGGCDSGDPLDFTLSEISQALELRASGAAVSRTEPLGDDYRPSKYHLSNSEVRATGILAGGAVHNIAREVIDLRNKLHASLSGLDSSVVPETDRERVWAECGHAALKAIMELESKIPPTYLVPKDDRGTYSMALSHAWNAVSLVVTNGDKASSPSTHNEGKDGGL